MPLTTSTLPNHRGKAFLLKQNFRCLWLSGVVIVCFSILVAPVTDKVTMLFSLSLSLSAKIKVFTSLFLIPCNIKPGCFFSDPPNLCVKMQISGDLPGKGGFAHSLQVVS